MGLVKYYSYSSSLVDTFSAISLLFVYSLLLNPCSLNPILSVNGSKVENANQWKAAVATWYGGPNGGGSDGCACGYGSAVENPPFNKMTTATGPSLYGQGKRCGACYQVKCIENGACSGNPVTVAVTDECPGCSPGQDHFDLSGTAFGALAKPGQAYNLRNAGRIEVQYTRVACQYGVSIAFKVDVGSNPYYFAILIEYVNGDSDVAAVELQQPSSSDPYDWLPMQQSWGAVWKLNSGSALQPPFSITLTLAAGNTIVANYVIPANWIPGNTYQSVINFP